MNKKVLVVTNCADVHADLVAQRVLARGASPFRLNLDEFPGHFTLEMRLDAGRWAGCLTHLPSNDTLPIADIGAVWLRKPAAFRFRSEDLGPQERAHAAAETEHILFSLLYALDCYWMSHPRAIRGALWKGEQLLRAARLGFRVPRSIVTNRPDSVREFRKAIAGDLIFKTLSSPVLSADKVGPADRIARHLPTTLVTDAHLGMLDSVGELPCLFQEYIPKKYELRVTVIGSEVFAARINSQDDERTRTDCRDLSAEIRYEPARLPPEIERRCRDFVHSYQLTFGALDLIVTPDDEHVFLENNPVGQFLFVEELVPQLAMLDAVAARLIEGARSRA
jgi:glutathione synthase/RimK-type ligase-like ATP-grasp enzyme